MPSGADISAPVGSSCHDRFTASCSPFRMGKVVYSLTLSVNDLHVPGFALAIGFVGVNPTLGNGSRGVGSRAQRTLSFSSGGFHDLGSTSCEGGLRCLLRGRSGASVAACSLQWTVSRSATPIDTLFPDGKKGRRHDDGRHGRRKDGRGGRRRDDEGRGGGGSRVRGGRGGGNMMMGAMGGGMMMGGMGGGGMGMAGGNGQMGGTGMGGGGMTGMGGLSPLQLQLMSEFGALPVNSLMDGGGMGGFAGKGLGGFNGRNGL